VKNFSNIRYLVELVNTSAFVTTGMLDAKSHNNLDVDVDVGLLVVMI